MGVEGLVVVVPIGVVGREGDVDLGISGLGAETRQLGCVESLGREVTAAMTADRVGGGGAMGLMGEFGEFRRSAPVAT